MTPPPGSHHFPFFAVYPLHPAFIWRQIYGSEYLPHPTFGATAGPRRVAGRRQRRRRGVRVRTPHWVHRRPAGRHALAPAQRGTLSQCRWRELQPGDDKAEDKARSVHMLSEMAQPTTANQNGRNN